MKRTLFPISCTIAAALLCGNATSHAGVMLPNLHKIKQMARDQAASSNKASKGSKARGSKKGRTKRGGGGGGSPAVGGATYSASINFGIDHGSSIGTNTKDNPGILTTIGGGGVLVGPPVLEITTGGVSTGGGSTGFTTTDTSSGLILLHESTTSCFMASRVSCLLDLTYGSTTSHAGEIGSGFNPQTVINAGTLFINGTGNSQLIEVNNGATLGGTGIFGGTLTHNSSTYAAIITGGSGTLAFDIGSGDGQLDQLRVNGSLLLGSGTGLNVTLTDPSSVPGGDLFLIFNDGTDPISGTFAGLPEGSLYTLGSQQYTISYLGNADGGTVGNDLVLRPVPEPTAAGLSLLAACMGLAARRRK